MLEEQRKNLHPASCFYH